MGESSLANFWICDTATPARVWGGTHQLANVNVNRSGAMSQYNALHEHNEGLYEPVIAGSLNAGDFPLQPRASAAARQEADQDLRVPLLADDGKAQVPPSGNQMMVQAPWQHQPAQMPPARGPQMMPQVIAQQQNRAPVPAFLTLLEQDNPRGPGAVAFRNLSAHKTGEQLRNLVNTAARDLVVGAAEFVEYQRDRIRLEDMQRHFIQAQQGEELLAPPLAVFQSAVSWV